MKYRILQRTDGTEFPWSISLDKREDMIPGWVEVTKDDAGKVIKREITLDKVSSRDVTDTSVTMREQLLIEENARLREQVAKKFGAIEDKITQIPSLSPVDLAKDEIPIPAMEAGEVPIANKRDIQRMNREGLIEHIKKILPDIDTEGMKRDELIAIALGTSNE